MWGGFFHPRDTQGRESRTLWFVTISWVLLTARFGFGGMELDIGPIHWASTDTATHWSAYMEGAVDAAERAVAEIVRQRQPA